MPLNCFPQSSHAGNWFEQHYASDVFPDHATFEAKFRDHFVATHQLQAWFRRKPLLREFVGMAFGLILLGLHCFLQLSSAGLIAVLVPACGWADSAFSVSSAITFRYCTYTI